MEIKFAEGTREELIKIGLLSVWDKCDVQSREEHDKEIREKFNRVNGQVVLDRIFNR